MTSDLLAQVWVPLVEQHDGPGHVECVQVVVAHLVEHILQTAIAQTRRELTVVPTASCSHTSEQNSYSYI